MEVGSPLETPSAANRTPIAPVWHTAALVLLFVAIAAQSALRLGGAPESGPIAHKIVRLYLPSVLIQLGLLLYVSWPKAVLWRALKQGVTARRLWSELGSGLLLYAALLAARLVLRVGASPGTEAILPHGRAERLAWIGYAIAAGFCEEMIFRGYLQRQIEALTWRPSLALLAQAVLFAGLHGYQGLESMIFIGLFGAALGAVARISGSLRIGIFCHCGMDLMVLMFTG